MTDKHQQAALDEARFMQLVAMFQMAAMQHMGKLVNPLTEEVARDLDQARVSIDILEMLQRKTEGNLGEPESQLLKKVVFELQMNYVDECKRPDPKDSDEAETGSGSESGEAGGDGDESDSPEDSGDSDESP